MMIIERGNWLIELHEQYSQFFEDCNWYDYKLIHIEFQNDVIMGGVEIEAALLGFVFRWRWNHTETESMKFCSDAVKEIMGIDVPEDCPAGENCEITKEQQNGHE